MTENVPAVIKPSGSSADAAGAGRERLLLRSHTGRPNERFFVKNGILASLPLEDLAAIGSFLEPMTLKQRMILQEPKKPFDYVYFMESGLISQRIIAPGSIFETAVVGYRGAVGISLVVGGNVTTQQSVVLFPGHALRIHADDLRRVVSERPNVFERFLRYSQAHATHCAQAGLCGVRHGLEPRLACWLCLMCDAIDGHTLPITHDYISAVLGLHRAGVTRTLIRFEEQGLVRKTRGILQVGDRGPLEHRACCCYRVISGAYSSLEHPRIVE